MALLLAGLPIEIPGQTMDRLCGSGLQALTTPVHALRRTGGRYGLATMCIGVEHGIAMVLERYEG